MRKKALKRSTEWKPHSYSLLPGSWIGPGLQLGNMLWKANTAVNQFCHLPKVCWRQSWQQRGEITGSHLCPPRHSYLTPRSGNSLISRTHFYIHEITNSGLLNPRRTYVEAKQIANAGPYFQWQTWRCPLLGNTQFVCDDVSEKLGKVLWTWGNFLPCSARICFPSRRDHRQHLDMGEGGGWEWCGVVTANFHAFYLYLCDRWKEGSKAAAYAPAESQRQHIFLLNCFQMQTAGQIGFFFSLWMYMTSQQLRVLLRRRCATASVTSLRAELHLKWWYMKHLNVCFEDFRQTVSALVRWQSRTCQTKSA